MKHSAQPTVIQRQSTATARAAQICCIRMSLRRPILSISTPTETLSTESRLTAVLRRTGSSPGSRRTSLARPRIVVVQGAISALRRRGIAASLERITTGRRPIFGGSHHHSSPRSGSAIKSPQQLGRTRRGRPTRRVRSTDERRRRRKKHRW